MKFPVATKYESVMLTLVNPALERFQASIIQPFLPAFFFFAGVTYDSLTLSRIDHLTDNLLLLLYLSLLGSLVIITGRFQLGLIPDPYTSEPLNVLSLLHRVRPHLEKVLQFLFGGLFSAYAILYSQSVSIGTSAIFLGIIVGFLVANEFLRGRYSNLKILVGLFAIVLLSFLTFFPSRSYGMDECLHLLRRSGPHRRDRVENRSSHPSGDSADTIESLCPSQFAGLLGNWFLHDPLLYELDSSYPIIAQIWGNLSFHHENRRFLLAQL